MKPLRADDIHTPQSYNPIRQQVRNGILESKRHRRVDIGNNVSVVFESRDSIQHSLEELLRVEHIDNADQVVSEVESFNALLPDRRELAALIFLNVDDPADLASVCRELANLPRFLSLRADGETIEAVWEGDENDAQQAVFYCRFPITEDLLHAMEGGAELSLQLAHPAASGSVILSKECRNELLKDLQS